MCQHPSERYIVIALFLWLEKDQIYTPFLLTVATVLMDATELVWFAPSLPKSQMNTALWKMIILVLYHL